MFNPVDLKYLRSITQDVNGFKNLYDALHKMQGIKNHDNYVSCIVNSVNYLNQYIVSKDDVELTASIKA
jgi:hypothetical protein